MRPPCHFCRLPKVELDDRRGSVRRARRFPHAEALRARRRRYEGAPLGDLPLRPHRATRPRRRRHGGALRSEAAVRTSTSGAAVRPPIALSRPEGLRDGIPSSSVLWELPAGLIEPGEAPAVAAARELEEELGFTVDAATMKPARADTYPAPGFIGEMHWFFHVRVDPTTRKSPGGRRLALSKTSRRSSAFPLDVALAACRSGEIRDAKTELALYRLHASLA